MIVTVVMVITGGLKRVPVTVAAEVLRRQAAGTVQGKLSQSRFGHAS